MADRSPRLMVLAAAGFAGAAALVWAAAFETARGIRLDARGLEDFMDAGRHSMRPFAAVVTRFADPLPLALLSAGVLAIALARCGVRIAAILGTVLFGACVTSQVLKRVTARPTRDRARPVRQGRARPRGRVATRRRRPFSRSASWSSSRTGCRPLAMAAGGAFALAMAISVLVFGRHFPSDVLGAFCVAAAWGLCGLAAVYPRPMNGIFVAITVRNCTFASSGRLAM